MTQEKPAMDTEKAIIWTATAERYISKINDRIDELLKYSPDGNDHTLFLNAVKSRIEEMFTVYENKNYTIDKVEEDLKYFIDNPESSEEDKEIYKQILAFVQVKSF